MSKESVSFPVYRGLAVRSVLCRILWCVADLLGACVGCVWSRKFLAGAVLLGVQVR